jgi:hypothetical protein
MMLLERRVMLLLMEDFQFPQLVDVWIKEKSN